MKAILGVKIGMTQVYQEDGATQVVTAVQCGPCTVLQCKTQEQDGYSALQLGFLERAKASKPRLGHMKASGLEKASRYIKEVRLESDSALKVGDSLAADIFEIGEDVWVTGTSIGKGFQGAIKRWNFSKGPQSHGSKNNRISGAMGAMDRGGMVPKGKKKAGHMGREQVTIRGLKIVDVLKAENVLLVSGAIPGPKNGLVVISNPKAEYAAVQTDNKGTDDGADQKKEEPTAA